MLVIITKKGIVKRFDENSIRISSRKTMGVMGIRLKPEDEIVEVIYIPNEIRRDSISPGDQEINNKSDKYAKY